MPVVARGIDLIYPQERDHRSEERDGRAFQAEGFPDVFDYLEELPFTLGNTSLPRRFARRACSSRSHSLNCSHNVPAGKDFPFAQERFLLLSDSVAATF